MSPFQHGKFMEVDGSFSGRMKVDRSSRTVSCLQGKLMEVDRRSLSHM